MPGYYSSFFHLYPFNQVLLSRECWTCLLSFLQEEIRHLRISMCNTDMSDHRLHMSHTMSFLQGGLGIVQLELIYWSIFLCPALLKKAIWLRPLGSCWVAPMYSHGMLSEGACFFSHLRPDAPNWWARKSNIWKRWKTAQRPHAQP